MKIIDNVIIQMINISIHEWSVQLLDLYMDELMPNLSVDGVMPVRMKSNYEARSLNHTQIFWFDNSVISCKLY